MTEVKRETARETGTDLWRVITGPTIWAAHFLVVYPAAAVYCAKAGEAAALAPVRWVILAATAAALALLGWLFAATWRVRGPSVTGGDLRFEANTPEERHRFLTHVALTLCALSVVAVIYVTIPALVLETCR